MVMKVLPTYSRDSGTDTQTEGDGDQSLEHKQSDEYSEPSWSETNQPGEKDRRKKQGNIRANHQQITVCTTIQLGG